MSSFVKVNGIWREFNPETGEVVGESGVFDFDGCEIAEAESIHNLDWSDSLLLCKNLRTGWLNPEGKFFGCEPWCHRLQAEIIHGKSERELEEDGWIRITYNIFPNGEKKLTAGFASTDETIYPSSAQLSYLFRNYMDNKHLYYSIWNEATVRKEKIKSEWGLGDE